MGATGKTITYKSFADFTADNPKQYNTTWWRNNTDLSNFAEWEKGLTEEEEKALTGWTDIGYSTLSLLYNTEWDNLSDYAKSRATAIYNALNKFQLKQGITVDRATNFKIFGAQGNQKMTVEQVKDYLQNQTKDGMIQNDGFMAFTTVQNGYSVDGSGLVIHLNVPPSTGAGAYIGNVNPYEREYLLNNNSILKFDPNSVKLVQGDAYHKPTIHVTATVVGRAKMQTIDKKNDSIYAKKK